MKAGDRTYLLGGWVGRVVHQDGDRTTVALEDGGTEITVRTGDCRVVSPDWQTWWQGDWAVAPDGSGVGRRWQPKVYRGRPGWETELLEDWTREAVA